MGRGPVAPPVERPVHRPPVHFGASCRERSAYDAPTMHCDEQAEATVGACANNFQHEAGLPVGEQPASPADVARTASRVAAVFRQPPGHILRAVTRA